MRTLYDWIAQVIVVGCMICLAVSCGSCKVAHASEVINIERLANAIYIAEGGANTAHPYGILKKYKHTTPRQACINTIKHKYSDWVSQGSREDFIEYLGSKYAPVNAVNDPTGLNKHWIKNVKHFYSLAS